MKFGVTTFTRGPLATREGYHAIAAAAEKAGFDFIAVNDHVVVPTSFESAYPYNPEGKWSGGEGFCFDQLSTLAFLASCTKRLQLLTAVMVVPHRHPVLAAKMLSTIDVLSEGRLLLGVGAGWLKEEFEILGAPFAGRGRATDEYIEAFKELWSKERPAYSGEFVKFDKVLFEPKPVQRDKVPIWVGGESNPAMRRTAKLGDVWYPGSNSRDPLLDTPERLGGAIAKLAGMAKAAGRDPKTVATAYSVQWPVSWTAERAADGSRRLFTGSAADMAADTAALAKVGVSQLGMQLLASSVSETCERIERFGKDVIAKVARD
jgi:probable F420-dependent oxidoreductase